MVDKATEMIRAELNSTEILIRVCAVLLVLFILLFISFFITLMVARSIHKYNDKYKAQLKEKYELLLTGIIFNEEEELETDEFKESKQRVINHFKKKYLKNRKNRNILREHIVLLHKNFAGTSANILERLYVELKLHKEALQELNSPDWGIQANAVRELAQLNILDAAPKLKRRARHENPILRIEAQVAALTMDEQDPFSFLDNNRNHLTTWHQINLAANMNKIGAEKLPQFSRWFNSPNDSIVLFCIKMTLQYDQFDSIPELIKLLKHRSDEIIAQAAYVLGEFSATDADVNLLNAFVNASVKVKLKIIEAIGKCGTEEHIPFLEQQLLQNDLTIATKAAEALLILGDDGYKVLTRNADSPLFAVAEICKQVLDERNN